MDQQSRFISYLSIQEAAHILKVSEKTLRRWEDRGILVPERTSGGHRRYTIEQLQEFKAGKKKNKEAVHTNENSVSLTSHDLPVQEVVVRPADQPSSSEDVQTTPRRLELPQVSVRIPRIAFTVALAAYLLFSLRNVVPNLAARFSGIQAPKLALDISMPKSPSFHLPGFLTRKKTIATPVARAEESSVLGISDEYIQFTLNVDGVFNENLRVEKDATVGGQLNVNSGVIATTANTGSLFDSAQTVSVGSAGTVITIGAQTGTTTINSATTTIRGVLSLLSNRLTTPGDLTIDPGGGGVLIGKELPTSIDSASGDLFVSSDFEVKGASYLPTIITNGDTITDFTGNGLQVSGGVLSTTLGTSIASSELEDGAVTVSKIQDGSITEPKLNITNDASSGYILSYDADGKFKWVAQASSVNFFTDAGSNIYVTDTTDDLSVGTSSDVAKLGVVGDSDEIQLLARGNGTQTTNILDIQNSTGTSLFSVDGSGTVTISALNCTSYSNGGALTADASGVISCANDDGGGVASPFQTTGNVANLIVPANHVTIGSAVDLAKFSVDGISDEVQFLIQGNSSQTNFLGVFEQSNGTDVFTIANSGDLTTAGNLAVNGGSISSSASTVNVFNSSTGTINFGQAANSINIGKAGGTVMITSDVTITGTLTTAASDFAADGAVVLSPSGTNDVTFNLDADSTFILNGLQSGSATSGLCLDASKNVITCSTVGSLTLQSVYDNDGDGSDTIIALTSADDSIIFRNPASSGTDSGYTFLIDQLNTGNVDGTRISNAGTGDSIQIDNSSTGAFLRADANSIATTPVGIILGNSDTGAITTAIDVSDAEIVNAISIGSNNILTGAGAITSTELYRLAGKDAALVDTNDAVNTAITGTGALTSGSIGSGFGNINIGSNTLTAGVISLNGDSFSDLTGNGLQISGGNLTIKTQVATDALSSTTSNGSGLEVFAGGVGLLQGCADGQILKWNETTDEWGCANDSGATSAIINVQNNGSPVGTNVDTLNFTADFTVTESPSGTDNIAIADDVINFSEIADALTLDANTSITASGATSLTIGNNVTLTTSGSGAIVATNLVCADCVALGSETTGNYVAAITAGNGLTGDVASEGATASLAVGAGNGISVAADSVAVDQTFAFNLSNTSNAFTGTIGQTTPLAGAFTTLSSTGVTTIGNGTASVAIDSTTWDVSSAGAISGLTGYTQSSGAFTTTLTTTNAATFGSTTANADKIALKPNTTSTNTFTGTITTADLTADHTYTLPNSDGTIALTSDIPTSDNYQYWSINVDSAGADNITSASALNVNAGTGVSLGYVAGTNTLTISATGTGGDITAVGDVTSGAAFTNGGSGNSLFFNNNSNAGQLTATTLTGSRTYTLPDRSGTFSLSGDTFTGDVTGTLSATGATALTIQPDAVALGTDTTGNYVASITAGNGLTGTAASEGSTPTLDIGAGNGISVAADSVAVDQAYSFTFTGNNTFTPSSTNDLTINTDADSTLALVFSSGTTGTNAFTQSITNSASSGTIAVAGQDITLTGTDNAGGANTLSAIKIENVTAHTNNSFYALNVGTGLTDILRYNGTQIISGAGVLQSAGLSGTYSNALTLSSTSNAITAGTLTINSDAFTDLTGDGLGISGGVLNNTDKGSSQNIFKTFAVSGQSDVIADSNTDTATFVAGTGVTLTTDASTDAITISATGTGGDITDVGNCASGACFTAAGTSGTSLYFYDADGRGQVTIADLTAARTFTLPDRSGTFSLSGDTFTGDVTGTLSATGATALTIQPDAVALSTDTTGNYVQSITNGTGITGGNGGSEGAALTLAVDQATNFAWTGIQTHTNSITDTGAQSTFNLTLGNDANADTISAIKVAATSANTGDADTVYGIDIANLTSADATVTETALHVGTSWDNVLTVGATPIINGSGVLLSAGLSGTYSNALTLSNTGNAITAGTLTVNSESFTDLTGNGLTLSTGALAVNLTSSGTTGSTSSNSGLEFVGGAITLLKGCADNELLTWDDTNSLWKCNSVSGVGAGGDITAVGDIASGAAFTQTAGNDGNHLYFEGSTVDGNEIDLTAADPGSDISVTIPNIAGTLASLAGTQTFTGAKTFSALTNFTNSSGITVGEDLATNTAGSVKLIGAGANNFSTTFTTTTQTQDIAYTLPPDDGTTNYVLSTDGNGVLTWKSVTGVGGGTGTITAIGDVTSGDAFTASGTAGTSLYFYDADGRGQVTIANLSAVRTYTLPDRSGTFSLSGDTFTGDVTGTLSSTGATALTIAADSVALGTDTTGNYVATIAGNTQVGVSGSGSESAAVSLSINANSLDFAQIADALTLDANTSITASGATTLTIGNNVTLNTSGSGSIVATDLVCADCVALGSETTGNYVAAITAGNGLTGDVSSEGATASLAVGAGNGITVAADSVAVDQTYGFTFTGNNAFSPSGTNALAVNLDSNSLFTINQAFSGTTSADSTTLTVTNGSTSGTQNGLVIDNAASTGTTEALLSLKNSDTDTAVGTAIKITNAGGNFTTVIDNEGTLISGAELNRLDGKDAALVDTNDAVATAITGTGALNAGSITSGFGSIDVGNDAITTTGTVTAGTLSVNSESFTDLTGNGLTLSTGTLALNLTASGTTGSTSSNSGLEFVSGAVTLLKGCADGEILSWDNTSDVWKCNTVSGLGAGGDITAVGDVTTGAAFTNGGSGNSLFFNNNSNAGQLTATTLTGTRTFTLPDRSGTFSLSGDTFTGDVTGTLSSTGATALTIAADSVALTTDTTGNYVASITNGNGITGGNGGSEGAALTVAVDQAFGFTFTGNNSFTPSGTNALAINLDSNSLFGINQAFSGSTSADSTTLTITNGSTSGTQNGLVITNAASTGTTEALLSLNNSDTDTAVGTAIKITNAGGNFTTVIDNEGTLISGAELNRLDGKDAALVDTNDAVATAITGTGALNAGSITSGFGSIDVGNDAITTTGTVTAGTLSVNSESFTDLTGNGLTLSTGTLALNLTSSGTTGSTSSNSGLEFVSGAVTLLKGCADNELLTWDDTNALWKCNSVSGLGAGGDITAVGDVASGAAFTSGGTGNSLYFHNNSNAGQLTANTLTGTRTYTLPDRSGTFSLSGDTFTGDVTGTLSSTGATALTIAADSVALGTDTTGNYVASITAGNGLTGDVASEGAAASLAVGAGNGISVAADSVAVDQTYAFAWTGLQTHTNTITDTGAQSTFNLTLGNDANTDTISAIKVAATSAATGDADTVYGIDIADLTSADATVTETALHIGTSWDNALTVGSTPIINGSGVLLSAGLSGTYSNALTLSSTSNAFTGTIGQSTALAGSFTTLSSTGTTNLNSSGAAATNIATGTGNFTIGNSTGTGTITTSDWTIGATGNLAGIGNIVADGNIAFTPTGGSDINLATTPGSGDYLIITGLTSGTASSAICLDSSNIAITCTPAVTVNLQDAYDHDADGSDTKIALTSADDSLIFQNPASAGTDSSFLLKLDQLATGSQDVLTIAQAGTGNGIAITTSNSGTTASALKINNSAGTITDAIDVSDATGITNAINVGANTIKGTTANIDLTNFDVNGTTGNITVAAGQGLDTNAAGILALGNTTATTVSIGTTAATTLNLGAGGSLARAINIGTGTGADTINIGTGATGADAITIGNNASSTSLAFTSGTGSQTFTSSATTNNAFAFIANALSSGNGINLSSTSTALTSGKLASFDWSPASTTTATGDLFNINIGTNGTTSGNLFSVSDTGSNLFSVSETGITAALPTAFTSAGDVSMAYDLQFTNQTASFIKALGPLTIDAGESFESNDLTFKTYNSGRVIADVSNNGGVLISSNAASTSGNGLLNVSGAATGKALSIFNETGDQNIIAASASGTTVAQLDRTGKFTLNTTTSNADKLALSGNATGSNSFTGTISLADLTVGNQTFNLPDLAAATSATICVSTGNCAGLGSGVTQSGTNANHQVAYFTSTNNVTSDASYLFNANSSSGTSELALTNSSTGDLLDLSTTGASTTANGLIIAATNASGVITDAIDVSDPEIVNALNIGANVITGSTGAIDFTNFDVATNGNITVAAGQGIDTNAAGILALGNVTATTVNIGGTAATTLNLGAGGSLTRSINIGTGTGADTIHIGDGGTTADTITIGSTVASTSLALNDDNWNITGAGAANFVSIGATTRGSGLFTSLGANGNVTIGDANTDTLTINAGSSGSGITFADSSFASCSLTTVAGVLTCGAAGGTMSSFTAAGDSGSNQTISNSDTLSILGGTNGIDTVGSATDTITLNLDTTEISGTTSSGASTFSDGTQANLTWTFNTSGATDPTLGLANNAITLTAGTTTTSGNLTVQGTTLSLGNGSAATISTPSGNAGITIAPNGTGALNLGTTNTGNVAIGNSTGTFALTSNGGLNVTTGGVLTGVASIDTISTSATALGFAGTGTITSGAATNLNLTSGTTGALNLDSGTTGNVTLGVGSNAKSIFIGNNTGTTNLNLTSGTGIQTFTSSATTNNAFAFIANSLTSGNALNLTSTSTGLTSGKLASFDWSPGSPISATGDLFNINIGTNGTTTGNLFSVSDTGSNLFTVSENAITANLPTAFTAAGDVSMAYDLQFTNQTASFIKSKAPLYIDAGENFESNDLTLRTYNSGTVVIDNGTSGSSPTLQFSGSQGFLDLGNITQGSTTPQGLRLPQSGSLSNPSSGEGYLAWDSTNNLIKVFDGSSWTNISGASTTMQQAYDNDVDGSDVLLTLNTTDGNLIVKPIAGTNFQVAQVTSAPTTDMVAITNAGLGTTTTGVDALSVNFVTGDGANPTNNGINLNLTSGGTASGDVLNGINLALTGTSGTEQGINFADNNFDLDINAVTDLNLGIGGTSALKIGSTGISSIGNVAHSIVNSAGALNIDSNSTGALNIGTGANAKTITIGNNTTSTALALTSGTGSQTFTSSVASTNTTSSAWVFSDAALNSGTGMYVTGSALTTGKLAQFAPTGSTQTTGTIVDVSSAATSLTTGSTIANGGTTIGSLLNLSSTGVLTSSFTGNLSTLDWSPTSAATIAGDLMHINIGTNGTTTGNLFNITDAGSTLFSVSETAITAALPTSFTAAGDVSVAYDLQFTNQTASYIKSNGPLTLTSGESFENNNLTLQTYGTGAVITSGKFSFGTQSTLTVNSTTPSVTAGNYFITANTSGTLISNFTNGTVGQVIFVKVNDVNTDIDCTSSNIVCSTVDLTAPTTGDSLEFIYDGTNWSLLAWIKPGVDNSTATNGLDLAEYYPATESLTAGDVISIDGSSPATVRRGSQIDGQKVIGVVSTQPGMTLGTEAPNSYKVALKGRVPVKIDPSSAAIQAGDLIGASTTAGYATKVTSGYTIGRALESWTPGTGTGTVVVYVESLYLDPMMAMNNVGNMSITEVVNGQMPSTFSLANAGELANRVGAFKDAIIANLTAGRITSTEVNTSKLTIDGKSVQQLVAEAVQNASGSGSFANNASISGQLVAQSASISGDATISGKLFADDISGLDPIKSALDLNTASVSALAASFQNWSASASASVMTADAVFANEYLNVQGSASITDAAINHNLIVGGSLALDHNSLTLISDTEDTLYIQATSSGHLNFLAGAMTLSTEGGLVINTNATFAKDVTVQGILAANTLSAEDKVLGIQLSTPSAELATDSGKLAITNSENTEVASINASGSATFSKLALTNTATSSAVVNLNATVGKATLKNGQTFVTIYTNQVSDKSLIYVTPTSATGNKVPYVQNQVAYDAENPASVGSFTVAIDAAIGSDISLNWWIIN